MSVFDIPTFLTRANNEDMVGELVVHEATKYLATLHGREGDILSILDHLIDKMDDVQEVNECVFAHRSAFMEPDAAFAHEITMRAFVSAVAEGQDITEAYAAYFKKGGVADSHTFDEMLNVAASVGLIHQGTVSKDDGRPIHAFYDVVNDETHHIRVKSLFEVKQIIGKLTERNEDAANNPCKIETVDIPTEVIPSVDQPGDLIEQDELNKLNASRKWRQRRGKPNAYKCHMTPDGSSKGTHWKFRGPIEETKRLFRQLNGRKSRKILVIGSGRSGATGMMVSASESFKDDRGKTTRIIVFDPQANKALFKQPDEDIYTQAFNPNNKEHRQILRDADIILSDVAVGDGMSYSSEYTEQHARELICALKEDKKNLRTKEQVTKVILYKSNIKYLTRRSGKAIYFGRGHNHEMFVLRTDGDGNQFVSQPDAAEIVRRKHKCDIQRNRAIAGHSVLMLEPQTMDPRPRQVVSSITRLRKWDKMRQVGAPDETVGEFMERLQGIEDIRREVAPNDPRVTMVEMLHLLAGLDPTLPTKSIIRKKKSFLEAAHRLMIVGPKKMHNFDKKHRFRNKEPTDPDDPLFI